MRRRQLIRVLAELHEMNHRVASLAKQVERHLEGLRWDGLEIRRLEEIRGATADIFGIHLHHMCSTLRSRRVSEARFAAMFVARRNTDCTLSEIGEAFGKRDHGTVLHGVRTAENLMATDKIFSSLVGQIEHRIAPIREEQPGI